MIALAAIKEWMKSANLWLLLLIGALCIVIYIGNGKLQERKAAAARAEGIATTATATVSSATETVREERKAMEDTPISADKAQIIEWCKREASCRSRGKL
jgi:hypothetical protein